MTPSTQSQAAVPAPLKGMPRSESTAFDQILDVLARNPYFSELSVQEREWLAAGFQPIKAQEGTVLIAAGSTPESFYILARGELIMRHHDGGYKEVKYRLVPNDYFGFKYLFDSKIRSQNTIVVESSSPALLYSLHRNRFLEIVKEHPELTLALLPALASHIPEHEHRAAESGVNALPRSPLPTASSQLRVKVFDTKPYQMKYFQEQNQKFGFNLEFLEQELTPETVKQGIAEGAHAVCVFVHDKVTKEAVAALKEQGTELVALRCAGTDAVDLKAADQLGVSVARVPAYSPYAIAEHATAMMMCLNRKLILASQRAHTGDFSLDGLVGFDMKGKTVGVIGTGKIGACLVSIMLGFGCRVLCYDVYKNPSLLANPQVTYVELDTLLTESDIISVHAPLLPDTHHMLNEAAFAKMKHGVMLINTSRGPLIDTKALIEALKSGKVGACGLDVIENEEHYFYRNCSDEPMAHDELARLLSFNNVLITAHQAFLTQEALREIAGTTLKNIHEFHQGKRMKGLTNSVNSVNQP